jgi:hypothetical protein
MPTLNSHTHCQAAQAQAQTKAWQRVCLSHSTADIQKDDKKEGRTGNSGFASCGVTCLNSSAVFQFNFSAGLTVLCPEIPHDLKAANRYMRLSTSENIRFF